MDHLAVRELVQVAHSAGRAHRPQADVGGCHQRSFLHQHFHNARLRRRMCTTAKLRSAYVARSRCWIFVRLHGGPPDCFFGSRAAPHSVSPQEVDEGGKGLAASEVALQSFPILAPLAARLCSVHPVHAGSGSSTCVIRAAVPVAQVHVSQRLDSVHLRFHSQCEQGGWSQVDGVSFACIQSCMLETPPFKLCRYASPKNPVPAEGWGVPLHANL